MTSELAHAEAEPFVVSDEDIDVMLELCEDDARDAIRILISANVRLQEEIDELRRTAIRAASQGYVRARPAPRPARGLER